MRELAMRLFFYRGRYEGRPELEDSGTSDKRQWPSIGTSSGMLHNKAHIFNLQQPWNPHAPTPHGSFLAPRVLSSMFASCMFAPKASWGPIGKSSPFLSGRAHCVLETQ